MRIANVVIKNFRALEDIQFDLSSKVNVIVGPNGVGKTTVLQALRLVKALLAARTPQETQNTLIALGAASPHFPQRMYIQALARDQEKPIEIRSTYALENDEIAMLEGSKPVIVRNIVQSRMGQAFANPAIMIQFLASHQGQELSRQVEKDVTQTFNDLKNNKLLTVGININPITGNMNPDDALGAWLVGYLDQSLPPQISKFSYFPADRALPFGEVNVQVGAADTSQQLESHNSQPQNKYNRLKNLIFNAIIANDREREVLFSEFETIFDGILKGRKIDSVGLNELGLLSVMIEDVDTKRKIEIDNLSSGEKNLILTFLLISRSVSPNGIALFDEPELHLNSIVCKDILNFILSRYSVPKNIQFIICTHSPEILSGAFSNDDCNLLYIKNTRNVTKIGRLAYDEYTEVLQKIGATVSESLLYEGTILVEGDDDVEFLRVGFGGLLKRYLVKPLGGRREVEKAAAEIRRLEQSGKSVSRLLMIIDGDRETTKLENSELVRILQWPRYSLENYLIDLDIIVELLKDTAASNNNSFSEGEISKMLKELALSQLTQICAREVYSDLAYLSPHMRGEDTDGSSLDDISKSLFARADSSRKSLNIPSEEEWIEAFKTRFEEKKKRLIPVWEVKWKELCNGKLLFQQFQKRGILKISSYEFKKRIMQSMKDNSSENWRLVESLLKENLS